MAGADERQAEAESTDKELEAGNLSAQTTETV
jgi:hypothetical protein